MHLINTKATAYVGKLYNPCLCTKLYSGGARILCYWNYEVRRTCFWTGNESLEDPKYALEVLCTEKPLSLEGLPPKQNHLRQGVRDTRSDQPGS